MTIKEKEKLRTLRDHILISEFGPIVFKNQAIVRPSIEWITVLSPICSLSLYSLEKHLLHFSLTIYLAWGLSTPYGPCSIYLVTFAKRSGCSWGSGSWAEIMEFMWWESRIRCWEWRKISKWIWGRPLFWNSIVWIWATVVPKKPLSMSLMECFLFLLKDPWYNVRTISSCLAKEETVDNFWPLGISSHGKKEIWFIEVSANGYSILEQLGHKSRTSYMKSVRGHFHFYLWMAWQHSRATLACLTSNT